MKTAVCKGCGRSIVWAVDESGQRIPLDPIAAVYQVVGGDGSEGPNCFRQRRGMNAFGQPLAMMVSHFATCSHANEFSKGARAK